MCLSVVRERINKPTALIQSGWKMFNGEPAQPTFETFAYKGSRFVPLDKWIKAEGDTAQGSDYKAGFHIYEDEVELEKTWDSGNRKRRVYYRNVQTRGEQGRCTVVVALELYVSSDPEGWPPQ